METILRARDLVLRKGDQPLTFEIVQGLTFVVTNRESGASTLSMALAGRFALRSGTVELNGSSSTRERFKAVALAGVAMIDSLERSVSVRETLRDQVAWAQPFFRRVPRDILGHPLVEPWLEQLNLSEVDPAGAVGDLDPLDRFRLRVALAMISRPTAHLLVVDDPDQLRDLKRRHDLLVDLHALSTHVPVLVNTVNPAVDTVADHVVDLRLPRQPEVAEATA
ncbi:hypothetical protein G7Y29_00110 [Corynebacterium qintianiae]|uniref:ABC transporter domain-containing protein n=1 Tax=Corynebacterium qintianiae TaxID=2709392 RepID=A0A7T0PFY6_9CORY|nr:hypothetical protein [Corynebacterium qintianiae]QPK83282.1 hypothetical protein G7Y29_00110 [Corynebacterium qintianiae]